MLEDDLHAKKRQAGGRQTHEVPDLLVDYGLILRNGEPCEPCPHGLRLNHLEFLWCDGNLQTLHGVWNSETA